MQLNDIQVRPVTGEEQNRFHALLREHHYLGSSHPVGEVLHYVATWHEHWIGLLSFSTAALKCAARDEWIGWRYRHQFDRLNLVTNNSRFLILPNWHYPNVGSRILSLCQRRIQDDWLARFDHPLLLLETFVDPQRFHGTVYRAANWQLLGSTKGFRRVNAAAYRAHHCPKWIFVYPLQRNTQRLLSQPLLAPNYHCGEPKLMLTTEQMISLPELFKTIPDPRRAQGRRHRLPTILAIAAGAVLCGRTGYKGIF